MDGRWYLLAPDIIMEKVILQTILNQIFKNRFFSLARQLPHQLLVNVLKTYLIIIKTIIV